MDQGSFKDLKKGTEELREHEKSQVTKTDTMIHSFILYYANTTLRLILRTLIVFPHFQKILDKILLGIKKKLEISCLIFMKKTKLQNFTSCGVGTGCNSSLTSQGQLQQELNESDTLFNKLQQFMSQEARFCW